MSSTAPRVTRRWRLQDAGDSRRDVEGLGRTEADGAPMRIEAERTKCAGRTGASVQTRPRSNAERSHHGRRFRVRDRELRYPRRRNLPHLREGFFPILKKHKGEFFTFDDNTVTFEGSDPRTGRVVMFRFPSEEAARTWYHDPEYQALSEHRRGHGTEFLTMVRPAAARLSAPGETAQDAELSTAY